MSLYQSIGTIAAIRGDSDKIEWFWDTLYVEMSKTLYKTIL
ncbi:hypothetical protein [Leptospira weilii]|nr:hypothetical protein [Leptospira weilii]